MNHSLSVPVPRHQLSIIEQGTVRYSTRRKIELPPETVEEEVSDHFILEMEAEALMLEMELG